MSLIGTLQEHAEDAAQAATEPHGIASIEEIPSYIEHHLEDGRMFRTIAQVITRVLRRQMVRQLRLHRNRTKELLKTGKPGILMTQHSFSSNLDFQPHWHLVVTDGVFSKKDGFLPLHHWDTAALLEDLRASILRCFVRSATRS